MNDFCASPVEKNLKKIANLPGLKNIEMFQEIDILLWPRIHMKFYLVSQSRKTI